MEKNRIRPIATGKNMRMSYARRKEVLEMPNLIEIQKNSYKWFLDEGLKEVFEDISPIPLKTLIIFCTDPPHLLYDQCERLRQ